MSRGREPYGAPGMMDLSKATLAGIAWSFADRIAEANGDATDIWPALRDEARALLPHDPGIKNDLRLLDKNATIARPTDPHKQEES